MDISYIFIRFILAIVLQFGGVTEMEPGEGYIFSGNGQVYEIEMTEVPAPDYYIITIREYVGSPDDPYGGEEYIQPDFLVEEHSIAGYQSEDEIFVFSYKDEMYDDQFFSVNEAGAPFVFPKYEFSPDFDWYVSPEEFPFRTLYLTTEVDSSMEYADHYGEYTMEQWEGCGVEYSETDAGFTILFNDMIVFPDMFEQVIHRIDMDMFGEEFMFWGRPKYEDEYSEAEGW